MQINFSSVRERLVLAGLLLAVCACKARPHSTDILQGVVDTGPGAWEYAGPEYDAEVRRRHESARRGRDIWFMGTGGNARFVTRTMAARLGGSPDFQAFFGENTRAHRFQSWGMINDPDCREPQNDYEREISMGWDICPGDLGPDGLLQFIGRPATDWQRRDPACRFRERDAPDRDQRTDACSLAFGTSTGVIGWRKFPNPNYKRVTGNSIAQRQSEPPFLIGMSCAACHAGFDPRTSPPDPERPEWRHINGLVGNRFLNFGALLSSGLHTSQIAHHYYRSLPLGVVHVPLEARDPRLALGEPPMAPPRAIPGNVAVLHAGDEDIERRVLRQFEKIGVCTEACSAGTLQSRLAVTQCQERCSAWTSIRQRVADIHAYTHYFGPVELTESLGVTRDQLLSTRSTASNSGAGSDLWERGRQLYAQNCASCHSGPRDPNQLSAWQQQNSENISSRQFHVIGRDEQRVDALSNGGEVTAQSLGTSGCDRPLGLYPVPSLIGLWARGALFTARNTGPQLCTRSAITAKQDCELADPSPSARMRHFDRAMQGFFAPQMRRASAIPGSFELEGGPRAFQGDVIAVLLKTPQSNGGQTAIGSYINRQSHIRLENPSHHTVRLGGLSGPASARDQECIKQAAESADQSHTRWLPEAQQDREALQVFLMTL